MHKQTRPNVVFVFADEWRAQATGYNGDPNCATPTLDKLASQSLSITHAVSGCPVCCPYRASFLTGQYPLTNGVFINDVELDPSCTSIARAFKAGGYQTSYIGKWHLHGSPEGRNERRSSPVPRSHQMGFDQWRGYECSHNHLSSGYYHNEDPQLHPWEDYDAFAQSREAARQLEEHRKTDSPLFLVMSWGPPHFPLDNAPELYRRKYREKEIHLRKNVPPELERQATEHLRGYYAHIAALDHALEILLKGIEDAGMLDNTLLVVTSDHGDMRSSQALQTKCFPFDESIRVPFLVRGPQINPGELAAPLDAPDIMPTLLGLCGLEIPASVEGRDWSPEILGRRDSRDDDAALLSMPVDFTELQFNAMSAYRGLRSKRYTYVRNLEGPWLLYDNEADPFQMDNLVNRPPFRDLQVSLDKQLSEMLLQRQDEFLPAESYLRQAGLCHYKEVQCNVRQYWRDPWRDGGPIPAPGAPPYAIA